MNLSGKVAIVTGAASGIGYATAKLMAEKGAKVLVADINLDGAQKAAEDIKIAGGEATATYVDALQDESIKEMIETAIKTYGKIDILHNNAGGSHRNDHKVQDIGVDEWDLAFKLNLRSIGLGCKYVIPYMIENGGGSIINTASMAAMSGDIDYSAYGSVKAGVVSLTRYVATQCGKQGIRCNAVAPGLIITPATENYFTQEMKDAFIRHHALNRLGKPEDIAKTVAFLASDDAEFITGQTIQVDGGAGMHAPTVADFSQQNG